ncbi:MAG: peptide chain release factor-like protein, partial [Thermodesulfovibrionales bacterium]|nr:peptide chain release factor-like protein [Thermodesulfovibrionales bacterium]
MYPVTPEKENALLDRMASLGITDDTIEESFVRSGGKGGQHVNKTSTCVYLKHIPTGIEVKCQKSRSQGLNRYYARVMLVEKIEALLMPKESKLMQKLKKIKKQKSKRRKRAMLKY